MALTPERQEENRRRIAKWQELAAETTWFPGLGVAVRRGNVYQHGVDRSGEFSPALAGKERTAEADMTLLGPLAGARADVVAGKTRERRRSGGERLGDAIAVAAVAGPAGLLAGMASRAGTGVAVVAFADGSFRERVFKDKPSLTGAQAEAARFNALAAAGQTAGGPGVADELERLAALHSSGVLDDEEFRAAKARIIGGG